MENQKKSEPYLRVRNQTGRHKLYIIFVASIQRVKGVTIVTNKNGEEFRYRWSIKSIERKFPDCGLLVVKSDTMLNVDYIEDDEKLCSPQVKLKGGKCHAICFRLKRKLKKIAKKYNLEFWKDYRKLIKG